LAVNFKYVFLYSLGIHLLRSVYALASLFNPKAKAFQQGRTDLWHKLEVGRTTGCWIWVHCASLGEFEQGRPVMEALRQEFPTHKFLLTFFSPSGFEVRKNYEYADLVSYLPWDTVGNARRFVDIVRPELVILVKYEFWLNYLQALQQASVPVISISTILRPSQIFFKWYGSVFRAGLRSIRFFFAQNDETVTLLKSIQITQAQRAGDTRFDRVLQITQQPTPVLIAEKFKAQESVWVVGSCWKEDMDILLPFINEQKIKFIIAPHEISESFLSWIEKSLTAKTIRYSAADTVPDLADYHVLLVDRIGLLARLYRYGEWAYVGGAFGKGLHNILEAASYGIPVFFGNRAYGKFQEAIDLIKQGGAFAVGDFTTLKSEYQHLNRVENYQLACEVNKSYVSHNQGATPRIVAYCKNMLRS
jgi:3-deoxy-D-manno-octulosonic-acid transferase